MATIMFELVDDSGVDYAFLSGFGMLESWKGKIMPGHRNKDGTITWEQPGGCGTYTADESRFRERLNYGDGNYDNSKAINSNI